MNDSEHDELKKKLLSSREFESLWGALLMCNVFGGATAVEPLTAQKLKAGTEPVIFSSSQGAPIQEAEFLATRLAKFFPVAQRPRWQEIFFQIAFGGAGDVAQRQAGGAPRGPRPETDTAYRRLAQDYDGATGELTQKEFTQEKGVSVRKLQRARRYVNRKKR